MVVISCLISVHVNSQVGDIPFQPGAASAGMGGVQTAIPNAWAAHTNPGLLPWVDKMSFAIGTENRFLLSALNGSGLAGVVPIKTGTLGVAVTSFGYSQFRRSRLGLSYGLQLGDNISGGISIHYDLLNIGNNYGSAGALSGSAGFSARVNENLMLAAYVFNPFRVNFSENVDENIPTILNIGIAYSFSEKVLFSSDLEKDINVKPGLKVGLRYQPGDKFFIRVGFRTLPQSYTFGFGLELGTFEMDLGTSIHPVLGVSPNLSLQYDFK